jgi:hypothetical protein
MNLIKGRVHTVIMDLRRFLRSRRFFDKINDCQLFKNRYHPAEASVGQVEAPLNGQRGTTVNATLQSFHPKFLSANYLGVAM